jgi:hypothetical protein
MKIRIVLMAFCCLSWRWRTQFGQAGFPDIMAAHCQAFREYQEDLFGSVLVARLGECPLAFAQLGLFPVEKRA